MTDFGRTFTAVLSACGLVALLTGEAQAAGASPWAQDSHSAFRLIAGANKADSARLRAGVEIKLAPGGWKTYWRYPGDSGVPPRFDFSGSENLKTATVRYPAPHIFTDEAGNSLGYKDTVIFPLTVTPKDPGKPVRLRLKLDYAVCEKICIPAQGSEQLALAPGDSPQEAALAAAQARVPKKVSADAAGLTARRVNGGAKPGAKPLVMVDVKAPSDGPVELIAEGPTPEWALPIPKPAKGAPAGRRHFSFELDGLPPGVDPTKGPFALTFTVIARDRAVEVDTRLD